MKRILFLLWLIAINSGNAGAETLVHHHGIPDLIANPTITTVQDGNWHNPSTWGGTIPNSTDTAQVNHVVQTTNAVEVFRVGVSGTLKIVTSFRTKDLVVYHGGSLETRPGTDLVFRDIPTDLESDPNQWGTGLLVLGDWSAPGEVKTPFVRATDAIQQGDASIPIDSVPVSWQTGDKLVLPRTSQDHAEQSEIVTLISVVSDIVTITGTTSTHRGIADNPFGVERFSHIGNMTRSIVVRSENPTGTRGHIAVIDQGTANLVGVEFVGLGRTEANPVNSTVYDDTGAVIHVGTNQIGRYGLHFHHATGTKNVRNCSFDDGRKWHLVVHGQISGGNFTNNVVYDCDGAGIMTENGLEVDNVFSDNLVVKVTGGWKRGTGVTVNNPIPLGGIKNDTGFDGSGMWFRSTGNTIDRNYVYDCLANGISVNGYRRKNAPVETFRSFADNEICSSDNGLWLSWSQSCCNIDKFERQFTERLLAWHCNIGVYAFHESGNSFVDCTLIGDPVVSSQVRGSIYQTDKGKPPITIGVRMSGTYQNWDTQIENIEISGFSVGITAPNNSGTDSWLRNSTLSNYLNIMHLRGGLDDWTTEGVTFLASSVTKPLNWSGAGKGYPTEPANIWVHDLGVVDGVEPEPEPEPEPVIIWVPANIDDTLFGPDFRIRNGIIEQKVEQ